MRKLIRYAIPLLILTAFCSCSTLRNIPHKDDRQWQAKYNASLEATRMFEDMKTGTKAYNPNADKWASIGMQIGYFKTIDSLRPNAKGLFKQDQNLWDAYSKWQAYHAGRLTLTPGEVKSIQLIFKGLFDPMVLWEGQLK